MLNRVKKWLGIEGVKLEVIIPDEISKKSDLIDGKLRFTSMNTQTVTTVKIALIERYARGRRKDKRIDDYELGTTTMELNLEIPEGEVKEVRFELPFKLIHSEMDQIQKNNFLSGGLIKALKMVEGVKSTYRIEAEANVRGVALNPFDKKDINLK